MLNNKVIDLTLGNGDLTKEIDIRTSDEIETIAGNVNNLLTYMREIMKNITHNSNELKEVSKTIVNNLDEVEVSSEEISDTIEQISSSMEETSATMNEISDRMVTITESVDGMVKDIENGVRNADDIRNEVIKNGNEADAERARVEEKVKIMESQLGEKIEKSRAVEQINQTIEYTANGLHNIASKSMQVTSSMKEIEAEADTSSKVSDALYQEVDKFKVE